MPSATPDDAVAVFRRALAQGLGPTQAAKLAGISRATAYRIRDSDPEIAALMTRNKPRARAEAKRQAGARALRTALEPVDLVPELVDDANSIGGPPLSMLLDAGFAVFLDKENHPTLRASVFEAILRVKAAPIIAELQRAANAAPVESGPERVRLVLPAKAEQS
jgi:hypothetical protein